MEIAALSAFHILSELYLELRRTSTMDIFVKIVNG